MFQTVQTNSNFTIFDEEYTTFFIENLVRSVLNSSILDIEESKQESAIKECLKLFTDYIIKYTEEKYGKKEALRLQASQKFVNQDVFVKFNNLGSKFNEAYLSFFESLE